MADNWLLRGRHGSSVDTVACCGMVLALTDTDTLTSTSLQIGYCAFLCCTFVELLVIYPITLPPVTVPADTTTSLMFMAAC